MRPPELLAERILDGDVGAIDELSAIERGEPLAALLGAAAARRDRAWGRTVTYSRKVFLPLTNLCRDRCAYCTFRKDPGDPDAWTMSPDEVAAWSERARAQGCKEALVCLGDRPESLYPSYRATLGGHGARSTAEYVERACEIALASGLLPHTNAGILGAREMERLKRVNVSLGLMLESSSERLCAPGGPHEHAPDKRPARRLRMIREAGEVRIPFTTGILVGIGETRRERVESLLAIRDLCRFGHIQEVIVQNFRAKESTPMRLAREPGERELQWTIAVARLLLDDAVGVQAPPNLSPGRDRGLLAAGINDFGGISPVSRDYVNPESPWPHLAGLAASCAEAGFALRERLAVYPRYLEAPGFLDERLRAPTTALATALRATA